MTQSFQDPLAMEPDTMREVGHELIDFLVDRLADPRAAVPNRRATPEEMAALLDAPPSAGRRHSAP